VGILKGVFNKRPPLSETWEVSRILETIKTFGDNNSMDTSYLTLKKAATMALSSASRSTELRPLGIK